MQPLAESWYTSGTFLGMGGIVVGIVTCAIGVWAAFRAANPRQELAYQVRAIVPLVAGAARDARGVVEIRLNNDVLSNPQVMELYLVNRGRRDIPTSAYDQGRPLHIDIGAPILKILKNESSPSKFRPPRIEPDGNTLALGPDLLKRGQAITLSLLVDGTDPLVTIPEPPFIDIAVRERPEEAVDGWRTWFGNTAMIGGAVTLASLVIVLLTKQPPKPWSTIDFGDHHTVKSKCEGSTVPVVCHFTFLNDATSDAPFEWSGTSNPAGAVFSVSSGSVAPGALETITVTNSAVCPMAILLIDRPIPNLQHIFDSCS